MINLTILGIYLIMGSVSCLYTETTWKFKREKIINHLLEKGSHLSTDPVIYIMDNRRYIIIIMEFLFAPFFFFSVLKDTIKLILGKSELS